MIRQLLIIVGSALVAIGIRGIIVVVWDHYHHRE